jgi:hypothetical protein
MNEETTSDFPTATTRRGRARRWTVVVSLILLGALLIGRAGTWAITRSQVERIRKAGYPASLAELERWYPAVPESENAAGIYGQAFARLKVATNAEALLRGMRTNSLARTVALSREPNGEIAALLASNAEALQLLEHSPPRTKCRYPINLKNVSEPRPHLKGVGDGVQLLLLKAVIAAGEDNSDEAFLALTGALGLSRSLVGEPSLRSETVRLAAVDRTLRALELVLSQRELSEAHLAALAANMHPEEFPHALARAYAGERCIGIYGFGLSAAGWPELPDGAGGRMLFQKLTGIWDRELRIYLSIMGQSVEAAGLPFPQRMAKAKELEERVDQKHDSDPEIVHFLGGDSMATMLFPPVATSHIRSAETQVRLMAAQIALAVERYRVRHAGQLPAQLTELVPKELASAPVDPFDGKPFRYKRLAQGYMIYSVGADGKDDGGLKKDASKYDAPYDVTFTVER